MSAEERLAAALEARASIEYPLPMSGLFDAGSLAPGLVNGMELAAAILAADPHLAADIETGQRMREYGWLCMCVLSSGRCVNLADHDCPMNHDHIPTKRATVADKARGAIEADR